MKTAKETYEDICEEYGVTMPPIWVRDVHLKAMREYAKQAFKTQREICFETIYRAKPSNPRTAIVGSKLYYQVMSQKEFRDTILNAPKPQLE